MADRLSAAVQAHNALRLRIGELYPDESDQELRDTIEGASELDQAVLAVLREARWRRAQHDAAKQMAAEIMERAERNSRAADGLRELALQALEAADWQGKITAPDMTVSIGKGPPKVIIYDAKEIPARYMRVYDPEPNKKLIGEALKAGEAVSGCGLSNAPTVLRVTTK